MCAQFIRPLHGLSRVVPVAGVLLLVLSAPCRAQDASGKVPELITDRPDFTESSEVVGKGVVQLESGFLFEKVDDSLRQVTLPELLVRIGIGDRVELRLASDGYVSQSITGLDGSRRRGGRADAEIGAKVKLVDASRAGVDQLHLGADLRVGAPAAPARSVEAGDRPCLLYTSDAADE